MQNEIWKDIEGFEGLYQINKESLEVRSLTRTIIHKNGNVRTYKSQPIKKYLSNTGYYIIHLSKNKKVKKWQHHDLVMHHFVGERPEGMDINHKNGIKTDNRLDNLEYCTRSENMIHAVKHGLCKKTISSAKKGISSARWQVLNLDTGIYYDSIKEAAIAHNWKVTRLTERLNYHINTTPFIKIERQVPNNNA